jgi:hypothetical protein
MFSDMKSFEVKLSLLHKHISKQNLEKLFLNLPPHQVIGRHRSASSLV